MNASGLTGVNGASGTFIAQTRTVGLGQHLDKVPSPGAEGGWVGVSHEAGQGN